MRRYIPRRLRLLLSPAKKRVVRFVGGRIRRAAMQSGEAGRYRYVFVVTYGRSGSTLLQGLLNVLPGYRVRGENFNALYRLYQADAALTRAVDRFSAVDHLNPESAWYGTPEVRLHAFRADLIDNFVANVLRPQPGDQVLGFKEVRYTHAHMKDFAEFLTFLREAFPACKIVFNHRDPADVAASGWWQNVDDAEPRIRAADERMLSIPGDEAHFHFYFDRIDDDLSMVRELYTFLGESFDEPAVRRALGTVHGPRYAKGNQREQAAEMT